MLPEKNIQTRLGGESIATGRRGDGGGMFFSGGKSCWDIRVVLSGKKVFDLPCPLASKKKTCVLAGWETPFFGVTVVVFVFVSRGKFSVSQLFEMINPCG